MTLFISTPKRVLAIDDAYIMALSFLIFFVVGRVVKAVIQKLELKRLEGAKNTNVPDPRGGELKIDYSNDAELAKIILICIADNERYLVKDPKIVELVFSIVKAKILDQSLIISPNGFICNVNL